MRSTSLGMTALLFALAGCRGCEDLRDSAVRVTVRAEGFRPGCVRLIAEDLAEASRRDERTLAPPADPNEPWVVAVYRGEGWSRELRVTAIGHEQSCSGAEVATQTSEATLTRNEISDAELVLIATDADADGFVARAGGGTDCDDGAQAVHPGAGERCDGVDQNCDEEADESFALGTVCSGGGAACPGLQVCAADGGVQCEVPPENAFFVDTDEDGHGRGDAGTIATCGAYGPDAGMAAIGDDCDDARADVHPGATERCDGVDNTCEGDTDEGFDLGAACDPGSGQCLGEIACGAGGAATCQATRSAANVYADLDLDGQGAGVGTPTCDPLDAGQSFDGGDCDDTNRWVFGAAPELCDQADNDCDSAVDEDSVCPGTPEFVPSTATGGNNEDWISASAFRDGGTGAVIAGAEDNIRVWALGDNSFVDRKDDCANVTWEGLWVDPRDGNAYLAGRGGWVATHPPLANTCVATDLGVDLPLSAMHGFEQPNGVMLYAVDEAGATHLWDGGTAVRTLPAVSPTSCLEDVHGISPEVMFAVGGDVCTSNSASPVIFRFNPASESWTQETLGSGLTTGKLASVHVVSDRLAYAVGGTLGTAGVGTTLVAIWNGQTWSAHSAPSDAPNILTGVVAFGASQVLVTGDISIWRYDGTTWTKQRDDPEADLLWDIAGSGPDDVWAVGDDGSALHWPD